MLNQATGDDLGHDLIGVVRPLAAVKAQREGERIGDVLGRGGREAFDGICHAGMVAATIERNKNDRLRRRPRSMAASDRSPPPRHLFSSQKTGRGWKLSLWPPFVDRPRDFSCQIFLVTECAGGVSG